MVSPQSSVFSLRSSVLSLEQILAPLGAEPLDDLLDGLGVVAVADEQGILVVHHDEVIHTTGRDEPPAPEEGAVAGVQQQGFALTHVPFGIGLLELDGGGP